MKKLYEFIKEYYREELGTEKEVKEIASESVLGLAYTTDDKDNELQVDLIIKEKRIKFLKNDKVEFEKEFKNEEEIIEFLSYEQAFGNLFGSLILYCNGIFDN